LSRSSYEKNWGVTYKRPGVSTKTAEKDWVRLLKELDHLQSVDTDLQNPAIRAVAVPATR